jgi:hypothetical protein
VSEICLGMQVSMSTGFSCTCDMKPCLTLRGTERASFVEDINERDRDRLSRGLPIACHEGAVMTDGAELEAVSSPAMLMKGERRCTRGSTWAVTLY